ISSDVTELKDMVRALLLDKKNQSPAPTPSTTHAPLKAVESNCVTCGAVANYNQGNTGFRSQMVANQIRPPGFPPHQNNQNNFNQGNNFNQNRGGNFNQLNFNQSSFNKGQLNRPQYQNLQNQMATLTEMMSKLISANTASSSGSGILPGNTVTNPKEDLKGITTRSGVAHQGPKTRSPSKQETKEKLSEMARTTMNEHCSAVILNKLPRKLGDPRKFLIPCEFSRMDECLALADLGASINLMPLSIWEGLSLPEVTPTCMTLELTDRSVSKPISIAKDVSFKVGTSRALIDVHKGELTLRIRNEAITYNLDQTVRYSTNYNQMTTNKINVIESACEEYSQEVLGFSNVTDSGTPTPQNDLIVFVTSPTLTLFGDSDFLHFKEADAFLAILNSEPSPPPPNQEQNLPSFKEELKAYEAQTIKSSVDEHPDVKLKDLPHHLEYAFLEGDNKLPVIIAKELRSEEKAALIKVLKSHKRAIAWKLSDIQGGFTVVENEENELIPTHLVIGWRVCIDYRKLNEATRKDHFPQPFMVQMLKKLAGNVTPPNWVTAEY
nr:hypothetical protein [Tanacetum cinerariifolium]